MSPDNKSKALGLIHDFEKHPHSIWPHVSPPRLVEQLKARVANPDVIAQQNSSWCGPAAFLRSFARDDAAAYTHLILDLVRDGKAAFRGGRAHTAHLHPHRDVIHCNFAKTHIADADWVGLATLRDALRHKNTSLRKLFDTGTYPDDIVTYYKAFGYQDIGDWTSERSLGAESAHGANHFLKHHYRVTARIHSNMLDPQKRKTNGGRHNHWVDLIGHFQWHGDSGKPDTPVSLTVFSWGKDIHVSGLTARECFANYYGFVCAKY